MAIQGTRHCRVMVENMILDNYSRSFGCMFFIISAVMVILPLYSLPLETWVKTLLSLDGLLLSYSRK